jgi:hypothetical protein
MEKLQDKKWVNYLLCAWIFIPALLYFRIVAKYSVNIPWSDDYDAILAFLLQFKVASFWDKLGLLFSQHNEHRIFTSRVVYVLYDALFGHINFRALTFIGDSQLLVTFFISIYFIRKCLPRYWSIAAFVWGLCLFDLNTYENSGVAMTSMANNGIVMFFFISLFFYSLNRRVYLIPAVISQVLCIYASGNGIIGSIFIAAFTFFARDRPKIYCSFATLLIFTRLYFLHYVTPAHETVPKTLSHEVVFLLKMSGAHFSVEYALWFAALIILILLFTLPLKNRGNIEAPLLPVVAILGFVMATICAAGIFRSNVVSSIFYGSKYMIYPNLLSAIAFLFLFRKMLPTRWLWPVTALCMIGMLYVYRVNYLQGRGNFATENQKLTTRNYYYNDTTRAKMITVEACKAGIYCRPAEPGPPVR